jgi:hypothetical protein
MNKFFGRLQNARLHFDYPAKPEAAKAFSVATGELKRISNYRIKGKDVIKLDGFIESEGGFTKDPRILTDKQARSVVKVLRTHLESVDLVLATEKLMGNTNLEPLTDYRNVLNRTIEKVVAPKPK